MLKNSTSNKLLLFYNFFHTATKSLHRNERLLRPEAKLARGEISDFCGPRQN